MVFLKRHISNSIVLFAASLAALFVLTWIPIQAKGFISSEVHFADSSASGLSIVPASCPSSPDYAGECDNPPITRSYYYECALSASAYNINAGQSTTLNWASNWLTNNYISGGAGNVVGAVGPSGSVVVTPAMQPGWTSITYVMSGMYEVSDKNGTHTEYAYCDATINVGHSCPNGLDVSQYPSCTCPAGTQQSGATCIPDSCVPQYSCSGNGILNSCTNQIAQCSAGQICVNAQCVCPGGAFWDSSSNSCVESSCPAGFELVNGVCTKVNQCNLPTTCADGTHVLNQCTGQTTDCEASYGEGWYCGAGSCMRPPPPSATLKAVPSLVASGRTTTISWTSNGARSCAVTGSNGDGAGGAWTGRNGSQISSPITLKTDYTLVCNGFDGTTITKKVSVNIIPNWQEQ